MYSQSGIKIISFFFCLNQSKFYVVAFHKAKLE